MNNHDYEKWAVDRARHSHDTAIEWEQAGLSPAGIARINLPPLSVAGRGSAWNPSHAGTGECVRVTCAVGEVRV